MNGGNIERTRRLIEAFNRGDVETLQARSTPDVRVVPIRAALEDTDYSGPTAFRDFWAEVASEWSQLELDMDDFSEEGERVVGHGVLRGTARTSGAPVETPVTSTCIFRDGLLAEISTLPDGA